jgi:hypothetical protein
MSLKCTVVGCRGVMRAMTGLQELEKLGNHMAMAHGQRLTMDVLLELRVKMENGDPIYVQRRKP